MNPEIQKELLTWLTQIRETAEKGAGFVAEQAPLVAREAISYGRVAHLVAALAIGICIAAVLYLALVKYWKTAWEATDDAPVIMLNIVVALFTIPFIFEGFVPQARLALLAWFAPRIYIIEWLSELVKGAR